jgi:hypothetical protein
MDLGAVYGVALHDPALRRGLVAATGQRPEGRGLASSTAGLRALRRALASALQAGAARLDPEPRSAVAELAGVRP